MAKMQPTSKFETFEAGNYDVTGLEFFTRDDDGPIYVMQEMKGQEQPTARYRTHDAEGNDGPPGSITPGQLSLLVHAFGVDPSRLPADPLQALAAAERLIDQAHQVVSVGVGDTGWIRWVDGMWLPKGKYHFGFGEVRDWYTNEYGTFCNVSLRVLCNADGTPSPLEGCVVPTKVRRESFSVMRALAPKGMETFLGPEDDELIVLGALAAENEHPIYGEVGVPPNGTRPKILTYTLRSVREGEEIEPTTATGTNEETEEPHVEYLYQAISDGVRKNHPDASAFLPNGNLSGDGKAWCKANLTEVCKEHSIPRDITKVTEEQAVLMLEAVGRNDLVDKITGEEEDTGDQW